MAVLVLYSHHGIPLFRNETYMVISLGKRLQVTGIGYLWFGPHLYSYIDSIPQNRVKTGYMDRLYALLSLGRQKKTPFLSLPNMACQGRGLFWVKNTPVLGLLAGNGTLKYDPFQPITDRGAPYNRVINEEWGVQFIKQRRTKKKLRDTSVS